MARRIELQGIANALNKSFVSRNNDFRGYWAIGQLKLFAIYNNLTTMQFFLPHQRPTPTLACDIILYVTTPTYSVTC